MALKPLRGRDSSHRREAKTMVKKLQRQSFHSRKEATGKDLINISKTRKNTADSARKLLRQSKFFG